MLLLKSIDGKYYQIEAAIAQHFEITTKHAEQIIRANSLRRNVEPYWGWYNWNNHGLPLQWYNW